MALKLLEVVQKHGLKVSERGLFNYLRSKIRYAELVSNNSAVGIALLFKNNSKLNIPPEFSSVFCW